MRRTLRIARLGIRASSSATAAKPKWQVNTGVYSDVTIPQSRSWARPPSPLSPAGQSSPPKPTANSSRVRDPPPHRSSPRQDRPGLVDLLEPHRARDQQRKGPNAKNASSRPDVPSTSKWARPSGSETQNNGLSNILRTDRIQKASRALAEEGEQRLLERQAGKQEGKEQGEEKPVTEKREKPQEQARGSSTQMWVGEAESSTSRNRKDRARFKERGSLISRLDEDVTLPSHSRVSNTHQTNKEKKADKAAKAVKPVNVDVFIPSVVSVGNLAKLLNVTLDKLRRRMIRSGMEAEAAHDHMLTAEYASLLALEFNRNPVINDEAAFDIYSPAPHPNPFTLPARPPVVTIMGHVDHGKTTLLDTLRSTSVAKGEAGGITQHIGAFSVPVPASDNKADPTRTITFLDTPGHAAFSAMRARGASVTDIVVLVVAADDGIMPQTREVLELVKNSKVGLVVAINKVDKPGVDVTKVEHALLSEGVQLETFGGDIPTVHVSGLTGQGLDQLVETISVLAEMQDLRAEREGLVQGYVLESKVTKGLGPTGTVLVLRGNLKPGMLLICGSTSAKVRILSDSNGKPVKVAYPGMAVTVSGWRELPNAGDEVLTGSEAEIKKALANRARKAEMESTLADLEAINEQRRTERKKREAEDAAEEGDKPPTPEPTGPKELRLVIKGDVSGSVEAVTNALEIIGNDVARTKIISTGVGDVTESDVMRAKAADGIVVAFSVKVPRPVEAEAHSQHVPILSSSVIYKLMDDVTARVIELLPPIIEKRVTGDAAVLALFDIHLKGKKTTQVGGCRVTNGVVEKDKLARVVRNGDVIHEGPLETLKQHKKDMTEIGKGSECGLNIAGFDDLRVGDVIEMYEEVQLPGKL